MYERFRGVTVKKFLKHVFKRYILSMSYFINANFRRYIVKISFDVNNRKSRETVSNGYYRLGEWEYLDDEPTENFFTHVYLYMYINI